MTLPLLLEPDELLPRLGDDSLLIVDLSTAEQYARAHIPGSVHLAAGRLQCGVKPAPGKLPDRQALSRLFSALGLVPALHVVIADDEGGGWAGRLAWTLDCIGHRRYSLLNGGTVAWINEGYPTESQASRPRASAYSVDEIDRRPIATAEDIMQLLDDPSLRIWDVRSAGEFRGSDVRAQRGGHIPGARHLEWTDLMDRSRNLRLLPPAGIRALLQQRGLTADKTIITHCQSHHRSGLSYFVAKLLEYPRIKAYDGSWAEWGNRSDTPIEID